MKKADYSGAVAYLYETPGPRTKRLINIFTAISVVILAAIVTAVIYRFYSKGQFAGKYWSFFLRFTTWKFLISGLFGTIKASVFAGVIAFFAGMLLVIGRLSRYKALNALSIAVIEFTRGVPTLLFIYFFFLVVPQLGINMPPILKIVLPVSISAAGVVAEVLRTGINAVPKGQREAALSLGMGEFTAFIGIVFPQGFKIVIPSLISEIVIVIKDTTYAYVVNYPDLMQNSKVLISNYDAMLSVYLVTAVIYILINYLINRISEHAAKKLSVEGNV